MPTSTPYSTLPGSDIPWLIARACAGEWEYRPEWYSYLTHPSVRKRFEKQSGFFVIPDLQPRSVQVGVEIVRRSARRMLENKEVRHFEVVAYRQPDCRTEPHTECSENGCEMCNGMGVLFVIEPGSHVDLLGWAAIVRVA